MQLNTEIKLPTREALKSNSRHFIIPLLVFLVITVLSVTFGRSSFNNIFATRERMLQFKVENATLSEKRNTLAELDRTILTRQAQVSLLAVPSASSGPAALSAIRTRAFERNINITEVKLSEKQGVQKGARETGIILEFEGGLGAIIDLIDNLKTAAPIVKISKIKMVGAEGLPTLSADLDLLTFWVGLPTNLPAANQPIANLNQKDLELIREMEKLKIGVGQTIEPAPPAGKSDPFTE
ncbi:MAG: hypothetical protein AAB599_01105 [Patescibacteria group bacterium]